jgi:hypothetical protein
VSRTCYATVFFHFLTILTWNSIESSDSVEDGVIVTNTGSMTLTFKGDEELKLEPGETKALTTSKAEYYVTCLVASDAVGHKQSNSAYTNTQMEVTIATIAYQSSDRWRVTEGVTVKGAKFSSDVPMKDE